MAKAIPVPWSFSVFIVLLLLFVSCCVAGEILLPLSHRLSHSDAHQSTSTQHLLKSSSVRSSFRHRRQQKQKQLHEQQQQQHVEEVSVPLSAGSDYTLSLSVGPNSSITLYMDTGSDLVWFPCSPFQCILCEGKSPTNNYSSSPPPPPPPQSKIVHCSDPTCSAAHSSLPSSDLCTIAGCPLDELETSSCPPSSSHSRCPPFYYAYGDGSLVGTLRRGHVSLSGGLVSLPNFTFACAHSALAEPVGVAGFGRGLLSFPSQLSPTSLGSRFSYCLLSHSFRSERLLQPSPLILGRSSSSSSSFPFIYTPILSNPKHPYLYTVGLAAISIGAATIKADRNLMSVDGEGNGGLAVDSGTTFTMLPSKLYSKIVSAFAEQMKLAGFVERAKEAESETGLSPCYYYSGRNDTRKVPAMKPHFVGGATLELPTRNYFFGFASSSTGSSGRRKRVGCLMIMDGGDGSDAGGGPAGTLGNFQQQGFEVVYDLEMDKVGFARRRCSLLWDQLTSRGRGG